MGAGTSQTPQQCTHPPAIALCFTEYLCLFLVCLYIIVLSLLNVFCLFVVYKCDNVLNRMKTKRNGFVLSLVDKMEVIELNKDWQAVS